MMQGGDSMGGELMVLADLSNVCALINSMAMIGSTVVLFILGTMATWRLTAEKEERKTDLSTQGIFLKPISTIRQ
jgi:ammonia channel protein AmtB